MRQPAVSGQMYRHFAVVTLCVTGALAVFADGENRQAMADEIDRHEQHAELKRAEVEKFGKPKLIIKAGASRRSEPAHFDYGDVAADYGAPMDRTGSQPSDGAVIRRGSASGAGETGIDYAALGVTEEEFARLDPSARQQLLDEFQHLRARQARSLLERSAARSGGPLEI